MITDINEPPRRHKPAIYQVVEKEKPAEPELEESHATRNHGFIFTT
jgi:hypothetical protein